MLTVTCPYCTWTNPEDNALGGFLRETHLMLKHTEKYLEDHPGTADEIATVRAIIEQDKEGP
ncbi:hypothetical protein CLV63_12431 [Murinocardiopsis flavida]|uniref:Uncharacterized protein n=1 Tax=Murinocardiopsis flavida TaxID=645275 RepID=A0A2P8CYB6_9ACTN|nr:hypothetical protein [Murinocardiopsis flavida]PSK89927.1 hypothetical protein CLV63_12431 [Murinocardiopsis flavida]